LGERGTANLAVATGRRRAEARGAGEPARLRVPVVLRSRLTGVQRVGTIGATERKGGETAHRGRN
jgi:hypothetical protein